MITQRIDKVLPIYSLCKKIKADLLILDEKKIVNRSLAEIGMKINSNLDSIYINGKTE